MQFFDGKRIVSKKQLQTGFARALRSAKQNKMIAKNLGVELALWVAGTRLIKTAFERVGISSKTRYLLVTSINKDGTDDAEIPEKKISELKKLLPENNPWVYKQPSDVSFIADLYQINLSPFEKELKMDDLENYVLQKISLLTVLM